MVQGIGRPAERRATLVEDFPLFSRQRICDITLSQSPREQVHA